MTMTEDHYPFRIGDRVQSSEMPGQTGVIEDITPTRAFVYYGLADYVARGDRIVKSVPLDSLTIAP